MCNVTPLPPIRGFTHSRMLKKSDISWWMARCQYATMTSERQITNYTHTYNTAKTANTPVDQSAARVLLWWTVAEGIATEATVPYYGVIFVSQSNIKDSSTKIHFLNFREHPEWKHHHLDVELHQAGQHGAYEGDPLSWENYEDHPLQPASYLHLTQPIRLLNQQLHKHLSPYYTCIFVNRTNKLE